MLTTAVILLANITSIAVNLYTLWSVRKTLISGANEVKSEVKTFINKI